jgi:hypothetical protein
MSVGRFIVFVGAVGFRWIWEWHMSTIVDNRRAFGTIVHFLESGTLDQMKPSTWQNQTALEDLEGNKSWCEAVILYCLINCGITWIIKTFIRLQLLNMCLENILSDSAFLRSNNFRRNRISPSPGLKMEGGNMFLWNTVVYPNITLYSRRRKTSYEQPRSL